MTDRPLPCWEIRFRRAGSSEDETLLVQDNSLVGAYKKACAQIEAQKKSFRIISVGDAAPSSEPMTEAAGG